MKPAKRKKMDERDSLMERAAALRCIRDTGRISKATEYMGMLTLLHPELSEDRRAELALEMAKED